MRLLLLEPDKNLAVEYTNRILQTHPNLECIHFVAPEPMLDYVDDHDMGGVGMVIELQSGISNAIEVLSELTGYEDSRDIPVILTGFQTRDLVKPILNNFPNILDYYNKTDPNPVARFDKMIKRLAEAMK